jgi:hypothetical protein
VCGITGLFSGRCTPLKLRRDEEQIGTHQLCGILDAPLQVRLLLDADVREVDLTKPACFPCVEID